MKINNNKIGFVVFIVVIAILSSCKKDWLEIKPDLSLTVPTSLNDLQALLDDNVVMNQSCPNLGEIASDVFYITDVTFQSIPASLFYKKDAYTWSKTGLHTNIDDWNQSYKKILITNIVLEGLNKITPIGETEIQQYNNIKGQALFIRGRNFFDLSQTYASVYQKDNLDQYLGIVLRTSSDVAVSSRRATLQETYQQILKDLNEARSILPSRPLYLTRPSVSAVDALLARIYLSMSDYTNSFLAANNCLMQYDALLDYNDISATATFIGRYNKEILLHNNYIPSVLNLPSNLIDQNFYSLYAADDLRRTRFFRVAANNTITFKGNYENLATSYFCGLATDEVYLTRAECHARAGRVNDAMKDLNDLLIKRWDKNVVYAPLVATNADEALAIILRERRKELVFRGVRWMDLRRLNKDLRFAITLTRTVAGQTYKLEPMSYKYTFPIPDDIIQATGMPQNPGWP